MAELTVVVYWRDIPAQVIVKAGRKAAKRQLADRFQEAIDRAAMRAGLTGTDAYLEAWRRAEPVPCGDDLEAEAAGRGGRARGRVPAGAAARAGRAPAATREHGPMYEVRLWSVRHSRVLGGFYRRFEELLLAAAPALRRLGYERLEAPAAAVERNVKGLLFDCRMCGQCVLSQTGMSCPMNCPKQMRNGPCGGVRPNGHCEVKPEMRCVWVRPGTARAGWRRATRSSSSSRRSTAGRGQLLLAADLAPEGARHPRCGPVDPQRLVDPGDPLPDLPGHSSRGRLERVLRAGRFAVTSELNPPDSADPRDVYDRAVVLAEVCDAINAVDASGAHVHMSSVGICALLTRAGYAVVQQISCRDKNRIAIQGDVLGAAAMGVANILCLTGDGVQCGDEPGAKPVFDLDSISLLETVRAMRDEGRFLSGRKLTTPPRVFLGAAANPFAPPHDYRPLHLAKKVRAGAQFIQTQYCFDLPLLERFMARVRDLGLHERCYILVGVGPLASARPRAGCGPACRASTSPTSWSPASRRRRAPRRRARRASASASR